VNSARRNGQFLTALIASLVAALFLAGCSSSAPATRASASPVAAREPETVLRDYFSAWMQGDWARQTSLMSSNHASLQPEPAASLRLLKLKLANRTDTKALYYVVFHFVATDNIVSMTTGTYRWTYSLTWDPRRGSWIISNYGSG
jgi:hypothetical protein